MLSGFGSDSAQTTFTQSNTAKPADIFDPFATLGGAERGGGDATNLLGGWSNFTAAPPTMSSMSPQNNQPEPLNKDPFANLGNSIKNGYFTVS